MEENELVPITVRLSTSIKEEIEELAQDNGVSIAEIIRLALENKLDKFLSQLQYVDRDQGKEILRLQNEIYMQIAGIKTELNRIGVNYNQEVKLKNLERLYQDKILDDKEFFYQSGAIINECEGFTPDRIDELMDRYEAITKEMREAMCYTRISHTKNGKAAIEYCRGCGRGHNNKKKRNLLIGSVGMLPDEVIPFEKQMEMDWALKASRNNLNQIRRIVASFSTNELEPNEDCAFTALEMAQEFVQEAYPDRKAAIFVQNDGVGGKLHAHILVSNVDSVNYKGCSSWQTSNKYVEEMFDRIAAKYITLDFGKGSKEKYSQTERALREENERAMENDDENEKFVWKDYLKDRIRIAMNRAESKSDYLDELAKLGIAAKYGSSKKYGEYISYEVISFPDGVEIPNKSKARSYTLGDDYGPDALNQILASKDKDNRVEVSEPEKEKRVVEQIDLPQSFVSEAREIKQREITGTSAESVARKMKIEEEEETQKKQLPVYERMLRMRSQMDKEERQRQLDRQYGDDYFGR